MVVDGDGLVVVGDGLVVVGDGMGGAGGGVVVEGEVKLFVLKSGDHLVWQSVVSVMILSKGIGNGDFCRSKIEKFQESGNFVSTKI